MCIRRLAWAPACSAAPAFLVSWRRSSCRLRWPSASATSSAWAGASSSSASSTCCWPGSWRSSARSRYPRSDRPLGRLRRSRTTSPGRAIRRRSPTSGCWPDALHPPPRVCHPAGMAPPAAAQTPVPAETAVLVAGPWQHRQVSAHGARFPVAAAGRRPLLLLLHGFPEFWWSWRHQLRDLPSAGFRVVAPDLRGYGASDKPPRGYDAYTLSADVAGLARNGGGQLRAARHIAALQVPRLAERRLVEDDAALVGRLLHSWGETGFPDAETERRCREAFLIPGVAHCAAEYYRWAVRSQTRASGLRFARLLRAPITAPTLQLHGSADRCMLPTTAMGSGRYVAAAYDWRLLPGVGHFPHQEVPDATTDAICRWASEP